VLTLCAFVADTLSFEKAAKLLSKTGSTDFPGTGNAVGYAARDDSGAQLPAMCNSVRVLVYGATFLMCCA
jgi:hypothetical protein